MEEIDDGFQISAEEEAYWNSRQKYEDRLNQMEAEEASLYYEKLGNCPNSL